VFETRDPAKIPVVNFNRYPIISPTCGRNYSADLSYLTFLKIFVSS